MKNIGFALLIWLAISVASSVAQLSNTDPTTQPNWQLLTDSGAPAETWISANYGQRLKDSNNTPECACGTSGWPNKGTFDEKSATTTNVFNAASFPGSDIGAKATAAYLVAVAVYPIPTIYIPAGLYDYTTSMNFPGPVTLKCEPGAYLNYKGTSTAATFGPQGLTERTYSPLPYTVDGCLFSGGNSADAGLYFNLYVTKIYVRNVVFFNFGNSSEWNIYLNGQNWDTNIDHVYMWDTGTQSFNGIYTAAQDPGSGSAGDYGNTQVHISHTHIQTAGSGSGVGIYVNGFNTKLDDVHVEMFIGPDIQLGAYSTFSHLDDIYMERVAGQNPCIRYGDNSGSVRQASPITDIAITNVYCNVHNTDQKTTAQFMAPATSSTALTGTVIDSVYVSNMNPSLAMIAENPSGNSNNWITNWRGAGPVTAEKTTPFISPQAQWNKSTPIPGSTEGAMTTASSIVRALMIGKTAHINAVITINDVGTASGDITLALPITGAEISTVLTCRETSSGVLGTGFISSGSQTLTVNNYKHSGWISSGNVIVCSGVIETQ